ncbi:MAG: tRNA-dihydrouridine synthase [Candidatus Gottesmanbacteria bacterium GW2011_GWA1_34_13]|uniref:tRNA-dihydrouridine synthase n=1 Tax=Candidatus Gottesmanbacteria bacterium GW2011_GWA1_34_13 TaxID=1618434 RepID=A0A0G0AR24_9BACT|nr:MAG: tRNA-dihydrouridine synthase [Candidatus Gottesmanbacteria bacterium GW2011_GWA1_34_13]
MTNFWQKLSKPISVLSPMEGVTDTVFRERLCEIGRPDVFYTEFINVDGLVSIYGLSDLRLKFSKAEKPIVAQIWGNVPDHFFKSAQIIQNSGFNGIDLNFGCADKEVIKHGCGAGLIGDFSLVAKIIQSVKIGAPKLPISVKTRFAMNSNLTNDWIQFLLEQNLSAIVIHGRNSKQNYLTPANWQEFEKIVKLRNNLKSKTLIIGNGDVISYQDGLNKADKYKTDGFAIARGILQNPWCFLKTKIKDPRITQRLILLKKHVELYHQVWGDLKSFATFKKYIKVYIQNFPEAQALRMKLMEANNHQELIKLIEIN